MKRYYVVHAWNIAQIQNGSVVNGEKYYGSRFYYIAMLKYLYALMFYNYVELFTATTEEHLWHT